MRTKSSVEIERGVPCTLDKRFSKGKMVSLKHLNKAGTFLGGFSKTRAQKIVRDYCEYVTDNSADYALLRRCFMVTGAEYIDEESTRGWYSRGRIYCVAERPTHLSNV